MWREQEVRDGSQLPPELPKLQNEDDFFVAMKWLWNDYEVTMKWLWSDYEMTMKCLCNGDAQMHCMDPTGEAKGFFCVAKVFYALTSWGPRVPSR